MIFLPQRSTDISKYSELIDLFIILYVDFNVFHLKWNLNALIILQNAVKKS